MGGTSRNSIEQDINASTQDKGYRQDLVLGPLGAWRDTSGLNLTGSTTPKVAKQANATVPGLTVVWVGSSAATVLATWDGVVPGEFAFPPRAPGASFLSPNLYDIHLLVPCRKVEATDISGDASLALDCVFSFGTPGSAGIALSAISKTIGAFVSDNTSDATGAIGESVLDFDIGAEIRAEIAAGTITKSAPVIKARDWFRIALGPHATVNASDAIEMRTPILVFRRHAALRFNSPAEFKSIRGG